MKIKLKQNKFQEMLEKLMVKDMFPSAIISIDEDKKTKEKSVFSIQKEEHGRAIRFVKFNKSFFDEVEGDPESIELDVERTLGIVKNIMSEASLVIETKGNKVSVKELICDENGKVKGEKGYSMISFKEPEGEILKELPFEIKDGTPLIGEGKLALDTHIKIKLDDFKVITSYAGVLKTEFYKFILEDKKKISVRVGNLHDFSDYHVEHPNGEVKKGEELEVIFTYGVPQIADTFRHDVDIKSKSNSPAWIYEVDDTYLLGVLVPPYVQE